jgi:hypothetical protein
MFLRADGAGIIPCRLDRDRRDQRARRGGALALPRAAHASRVANAPDERRTRRTCAHRNRPRRYDGRVVVTLCADEILYLPVTTEITSLPQLTPEGLPLALAQRAAEETRMARAVADLEERGEAVTSRALAEAAHISLNTACTWLRQRETGTLESRAALSVLPYSPYSTSDNIPAAENRSRNELPERALALVDPPEAVPAPADDEPLRPARPSVCPAASHQLLWRWSAGSWQCPACGT